MVPPTGPTIAAFKPSQDLNIPLPSPKVTGMLPPLSHTQQSRSVTALGQAQQRKQSVGLKQGPQNSFSAARLPLMNSSHTKM